MDCYISYNSARETLGMKKIFLVAATVGIFHVVFRITD